jgi:Zn-dependent protease
VVLVVVNFLPIHPLEGYHAALRLLPRGNPRVMLARTQQYGVVIILGIVMLEWLGLGLLSWPIDHLAQLLVDTLGDIG